MSAHRQWKCLPKLSTRQGDGIHEGGEFVTVSGLALGHGAPFLQRYPSPRAGVVRAMARSDHWRCVSTPRWVHLVEGDLQNKPFQPAAGSVQSRA